MRRVHFSLQSQRIQSLLAGRAWQPREAAGHAGLTVRKQRETDASVQLSSSFYTAWDLRWSQHTHGGAPSFLPQLNLSGNTLKSTPRGVSPWWLNCSSRQCRFVITTITHTELVWFHTFPNAGARRPGRKGAYQARCHRDNILRPSSPGLVLCSQYFLCLAQCYRRS